MSYPINSTIGASRLGFSEETEAKLAAATSGAERHEIAAADEKSAYGKCLEALNNVANQAGDDRPNPTRFVSFGRYVFPPLRSKTFFDTYYV